jgi:glycosyltransferase involved in cell wall biosynthesis
MSTASQSAPPALRPRVSVIIPHLNMPEMLMRCLDSVTSQRLDHGLIEIIVVDNGSHVALDSVSAAYPQVTILHEPKPGPGLALNRGIAAANAPVLAFIDADCRAAPGWLAAAVEAVEPMPNTTVVGGDVRIDFTDPKHLTPIEAYEAVFAFRQQFYIKTRHFSGTGNLAMGAAVHKQVGPFAGIEIAEDMDWGQRAHRMGFVTRYIPGMRVYHPARKDFSGLASKWQRHISHEFYLHRENNRSMLRWHLISIAVLGSIFIHGARMFTSRRLSGFGNRMRGLTLLVRTRWYRFVEMSRVARSPAQSGALFWNRQS